MTAVSTDWRGTQGSKHQCRHAAAFMTSFDLQLDPVDDFDGSVADAGSPCSGPMPNRVK
jgi:hypothetical protein